MGVEIACSFAPTRTARTKLVLFSRPTTDWLRGSANSAAPIEASDLDEAAVHATVDDAVALQVLRADGQLRPHLVLRSLA